MRKLLERRMLRYLMWKMMLKMWILMVKLLLVKMMSHKRHSPSGWLEPKTWFFFLWLICSYERFHEKFSFSCPFFFSRINFRFLLMFSFNCKNGKSRSESSEKEVASEFSSSSFCDAGTASSVIISHVKSRSNSCILLLLFSDSISPLLYSRIRSVLLCCSWILLFSLFFSPALLESLLLTTSFRSLFISFIPPHEHLLQPLLLLLFRCWSWWSSFRSVSSILSFSLFSPFEKE